jgi:hypothetical protein
MIFSVRIRPSRSATHSAVRTSRMCASPRIRRLQPRLGAGTCHVVAQREHVRQRDQAKSDGQIAGAIAVCGRAVSALSADGLGADESERQLGLCVTCKGPPGADRSARPSRASPALNGFPPREVDGASGGRPGVRSGVHQGAHVVWRYCRRGRSRYISPAATSAQAERMRSAGEVR